jgi:hypothetical protein
MAYEYEADEWAAAVNGMTEMERAVATENRYAYLGVIGDCEDARYE